MSDKNSDKKIKIGKIGKKTDKTPLQQLNLPKNLDDETRKKIAAALKQWLDEE